MRCASAILLLAALSACADRRHAPGPSSPLAELGPAPSEMLGAAAGSAEEEPRAAVLLGEIGLGAVVTPAGLRSPDGAALRARVARQLDRAAGVLAPLCQPSCGIVTPVPDPALRTGAALRPQPNGSGSLVLYSPARVTRMTEDELFWAVAHEYGHHLELMVAPGGASSSWHDELRAEALAGCAMARAGVAGAALIKYFGPAIAPADGPIDGLRRAACGIDESHPPARSHWAAIQSGIELCRGGMSTPDALRQSADRLATSAHAEAMKARAALIGLGERAPCRASAAPR